MTRHERGSTRRDFLRFGCAGFLGLSLADLLRLEAGSAGENAKERRADSVIMIWLGGGPATIDMWDLKPDAPEGIRGEFKPISTALGGVHISEHLPRMAKTLNKVTLIRSLQHTLPVHIAGSRYMTTGNSPIGSLTFPSLGSLAARLLPVRPDLPPYVAVGGKGAAAYAGYLGTAYNPFIVEGLTAGKTGKVPLTGKVQMRGVVLPTGFTLEQLENREKLLKGFDRGLAALDQVDGIGAGLDTFHKKALDILRSDRTRQALELNRESESTRERYGATGFGQGALMARRLVEAGVRFTTLSLGGWDTHKDNFPRLKTALLPELDQTLSALIEDLSDRGMLERTIVYCAGEFGRTPKINPEAGRDHWARAQTVLLAGGRFRRGCVYGSTDRQAMAPVADPCTPDDISATLFSCLGIDPHRELMSDTGRPIQLFREGKVMDKVLG
jgi:uncharacterized protein (DUF1501 family)